MKNRTVPLLILAAALALFLSAPRPLPAQNIQDAVEELTGDIGQGYLQSFFECFADNLNSGIYTSARIPRVGLRLRLNLVAMGTSIADDDREFKARPPQPYDQTPVTTATVFGDDGAVVPGPGVSYRFQDGQITGDFFPFAVPQVEVGSIMGTIARVRYFSAKIPGDLGEDLGKVKLIGYGLQHSLSQYILLCPIDISAGVFIQKFEISDIMECNTMNYGVQVSKSLAALTVFGGANMESGKMEVSYDYQGEATAEKIDFEIESKTKFRFHAGAGLDFPGFHLSGAAYMGSRMSYAVNLGLGL